MYIPENDMILHEVLGAFDFPATLVGAVRYGQGHINDTFCVLCQPQEGDCIRFILQGLSKAAFPRQDELMENFIGITSHLRKKIIANGGDPLRETLSLVKTKDGKDYYTDATGKAWRLTPFIENTDCYQSATPELFEASARAFGRFQYLLSDYPAETLHESIVNFHNTEDRFAKFEAALAADKMGRAKEVEAEVKFAMDRKADCSVALQALRDGKLPLRVTHNDTKLNNILIDRDTKEGICVIDLDTTMPGLSINDFGDSIRFGASTAAEDEKDALKAEAKKVAKALQDSGWLLACHSYTHNQYWNKKTITMEQEQYDIGRWLGEIAPYVGDTNIFISPFGVSFDGDDQRFRYLVDHGFNIYCPVDSYQPCYVKDDYMIQGRINLDGLTMKRYPERISRHFFDPTPILDPARPD